MCFETKGSPHRLPFVLAPNTNVTGKPCAICERQIEEAKLFPKGGRIYTKHSHHPRCGAGCTNGATSIPKIQAEFPPFGSKSA